MKHNQHKILQGAVIAAGVFLVLLVLADLNTLLRTLRGFSVWLLLPIFLLKLVNYTFRYLEWHYLLGVVGVRVGRELRLTDSIAIFLTGFPMALSPGKAAELLKAAMVKNLTGTPITRTAPVVLTERIVDGFAVLLIIGAAGLWAGDAVFKEVADLPSGYIRAVLLLTLAAMVGGILVLQFRRLALFCLLVLRRVPLVRRAVRPLLALYQSSYQLLQLRRLIPTVSFGVVAYGTDCIALYLMLRGLDVAGGAALFAQASFILGFAVIVAALSAMPGGAGARELSVGGLLVGLAGVPEPSAAAAVVVNTFFQVGLGVLVGALVALLFRRRLFGATEHP